MKIIVDTNVLSDVFDPNAENHDAYKPVKRCIVECKGVLVYGGTKLTGEYSKKINLLGKLLIELKNKRKILALNKDEVDGLESSLTQKVNNPNFDDPHIISCAILSKADLICTNDKRADKYIKDKSLYPKRVSPPKIYRSKTHKELLNPCW
ncbi:MAG: hypothetical protein ACRCYO_10725 [Bacteroidia bacterium]